MGLHAEERRVAVPGLGTVRVLDIPGDATREPVVLLHGIASVTAAAVPLLPSFGGRRVLAVDLPGHGLSDPIRLRHGQEAGRTLAATVPPVIDAAGVPRAIVVGHSLGGQIALRATAVDPRIGRLVLLGAPGAGFAGVRPAATMRIAAAPLVGRALLSMPVGLDAYRRNSEALLGPGVLDRWPAEIAEVGWRASRRPGSAASLASVFRALLSLRGVRPGVALTPAELAAVAVPVLSVWGRSDVFLTPAVGRGELARIPGSELVEVDGGHAPWLDRPDEVGAAVARFLG